MTGSIRNPSDLVDRIQAFVDVTQTGTVTQEQLAEFEQLLRQHAEAQFLYSEVIKMSVCLPRVLAGVGPGGNGRGASGRGEHGRDDDGSNGKASIPFPLIEPVTFPVQIGPESAASPLPSLEADDPSRGIPLLFRPTPLSLFIASVVIGSLLMVLAVWTAPRYRGPRRLQPDLLAPYVARLTRAVDYRWADPATSPIIGSFLRQGQVLNLDAGLIEIRLDEGARVIVEGPGSMIVESAGSVGLERGKLVAMVPAEAAGFTVRTPHAVLRDLGTEFGVEVDPDACTQLCVFQGGVRVETSGMAAEAGRVVQAGQAVRVATLLGVTVLDTPAKPERFVRDLPQPPQINSGDLASTFDGGLEGWTRMPSRKGSGLSHQQVGGNPSGFLLISNIGPGTKLIAPPRYHGNLLRFDGGVISFDAKFIEAGDDEKRAAGFDFGLITITGDGRTATQQIAASPPTARWNTYRGSFTAAAFGVPEDQWQAILADVTGLTINLNAFRGVPNEVLALDNILLRPGSDNTPGTNAK